MSRIYRKRINFHGFSDDNFLSVFKVQKPVFNRIHQKIRKNLDPFFPDNVTLTAKEKILLSLDLLGSGGFQRSIGAQHGIVKSTVCKNFHEVCELIVDNFYQTEIHFPPKSEIASIKRKFSNIANMPNFIAGCIDGCLIEIDAPHQEEQQFVDRNGNHSVNLSAICGPEAIFYWASCSFPGSVNDSRVFRESRLFDDLMHGRILPPDSVILGDSAYGATPFLIPPISRDPNCPAEQRFLIAHRSTRQIIERCFGMLKREFPILNHLRYSPQKSCTIIKTCLILHNMRKRYSQFSDSDTESDEVDSTTSDSDENEIQEMSAREIKRKTEDIRRRCIEHFE